MDRVNARISPFFQIYPTCLKNGFWTKAKVPEVGTITTSPVLEIRASCDRPTSGLSLSRKSNFSNTLGIERDEVCSGVSCCHKLSSLMRKIYDFFFVAKYRSVEEVPVCYLAMLPEDDPQEMVDLRQELAERYRHVEVLNPHTENWNRYYPGAVHIYIQDRGRDFTARPGAVVLRFSYDMVWRASNLILHLQGYPETFREPILSESQTGVIYKRRTERFTLNDNEELHQKITEVAHTMINRSVFRLILFSDAPYLSKVSMMKEAFLGKEPVFNPSRSSLSARVRSFFGYSLY